MGMQAGSYLWQKWFPRSLRFIGEPEQQQSFGYNQETTAGAFLNKDGL